MSSSAYTLFSTNLSTVHNSWDHFVSAADCEMNNKWNPCSLIVEKASFLHFFFQICQKLLIVQNIQYPLKRSTRFLHGYFSFCFGIISVVYLSEKWNFIWFKTSFCQIFKMASSSLKENGVPNEIVVRNVVLHNIFPMMVRSVMLWVLRFARTL